MLDNCAENFLSPLMNIKPGDNTENMLLLNQDEVSKRCADLYFCLKKYRNFRKELMKVTRLEQLTGFSENGQKKQIFYTNDRVFRSQETYPHYKMICQITGSEIQGLVRHISFNQCILNYANIQQPDSVNQFSDLWLLKFLETGNWFDFYIQLLRFQNDLTNSSLKFDKNILKLASEPNKSIEGYFKAFKKYYFELDNWYLSLIFVFYEEVNKNTV